jgi:hypothetical protein
MHTKYAFVNPKILHRECVGTVFGTQALPMRMEAYDRTDVERTE